MWEIQTLCSDVSEYGSKAILSYCILKTKKETKLPNLKRQNQPKHDMWARWLVVCHILKTVMIFLFVYVNAISTRMGNATTNQGTCCSDLVIESSKLRLQRISTYMQSTVQYIFMRCWNQNWRAHAHRSSLDLQRDPCYTKTNYQNWKERRWATNDGCQCS